MARHDVARERLHAQHLVRPLATPANVVAHLLAVQAQDYAGARWAVGQRTRAARDTDVERAFDTGEIVRTHVLRPTWHFVAPADVRWLLALTAPRVHAAAAPYYRKLGLSAAKLAGTDVAIADALRGGHHLTREEIGTRLGIAPSGVELAHVMLHAELEQVVVSGPRRGKQQTYALLDERVPPSPPRTRDDALAELARRYVTSHGPAQVKDLAWWSGLTISEARRAIELAGDVLVRVEVDGVVYHRALPRRRPVLADPTVHLLPNYDECLVAFADRTAAHDPRIAQLDAAVVWNHFVLSNGRLIGGFRLVRDKRHVVVACTLLVSPTSAERAALHREVERYGAFLGVPVRATIRRARKLPSRSPARAARRTR
jgi:hypothetical protein